MFDLSYGKLEVVLKRIPLKNPKLQRIFESK
jgi:hypothetical protein